jgi:hypothetical protein
MMSSAQPARADDLPARRAGWWELHTVTQGARVQEMVHHVCLDHDTDGLLNKMGMARGNEACKTFQVRVSGSRVTIHAVCPFGGSQLTSDAVVTYQGDSAYRTESHGTFSPSFMGRTTTESTQEGHWTGACPDGIRPGDMTMRLGGASGREVKTNLKALTGG